MIVPKSRQPRACAHCGETFIPRNNTHRYCGYSCSSKDRVRKTRPAEERFWEKVDKHGPIPEHRPDLGPCWVWTGVRLPAGYGRFFVTRDASRKKVERYAHRFSYELAVGSIPTEAEIDHLCRNTSCVNPRHLEPVTHLENFIRSRHPSALVFQSERCGKGHERIPSNGHYDRKSGYWHCRICDTERARQRRAQRKENANGTVRTR